MVYCSHLLIDVIKFNTYSLWSYPALQQIKRKIRFLQACRGKASTELTFIIATDLHSYEKKSDLSQQSSKSYLSACRGGEDPEVLQRHGLWGLGGLLPPLQAPPMMKIAVIKLELNFLFCIKQEVSSTMELFSASKGLWRWQQVSLTLLDHHHPQ